MTRGLSLVMALLAVAAFGCTDDRDVQEPVQMKTLENSAVKLRPVTPPQQIVFDQGPQGGTEEGDESTETPSSIWVQDLPFAPKIAMDPVDGSKLSIRRDTPIADYKGRIYYFSTESNRREFIRNPDQYMSGAFASYN